MNNLHNVKVAELFGIMLGDGYLYAKDGVYIVGVFGHSIDDKKYMLGFVSKLLEDIFSLKAKVSYHRTRKGIILKINRKCAVEKMLKLGFKAGKKSRNNIGIPEWIFKDKEFLKACIRGLIDTDGCIYAKWAYPSIPQIEFYNTIPKLREDFRKAMKILNIKTGKWRWKPNHSCPACGIYGKEAVFKYCKKIGFNNPKHIRRLQKIRPGSMSWSGISPES